LIDRCPDFARPFRHAAELLREGTRVRGSCSRAVFFVGRLTTMRAGKREVRAGVGNYDGHLDHGFCHKAGDN